jgi:hypothetical protein
MVLGEERTEVEHRLGRLVRHEFEPLSRLTLSGSVRHCHVSQTHERPDRFHLSKNNHLAKISRCGGTTGREGFDAVGHDVDHPLVFLQLSSDQ